MEARIITGAVTAIVAAAIISPIICLIGLMIAKAARGRRPGYFNIWYKPEHGTEFCRAHLAGKVYRLDNRALYLIEIHPEDAAKACAWTVPETELRGVYLLEKGKFYKSAFEEELYD